MFAHPSVAGHRRWKTLPKFTRRTIVLSTAAVLVVGGWCATAVSQITRNAPDRMSSRPLDPAQPTTYHDVLVFGLKARLPSELAYVDSVVLAVERGKLPSRLVDQTFFWARTRASRNMFGRANRPIIYFIAALNARVAKLGLNVHLEGGLP
jgi:hypothetical protein